MDSELLEIQVKQWDGLTCKCNICKYNDILQILYIQIKEVFIFILRIYVFVSVNSFHLFYIIESV